MQLKQPIKRASIVLKNIREKKSDYHSEGNMVRRILVSGILSILLILVIIYTLPRTILTTTSLIEYATIVALIIFLFVLLFRYFAILVMAYLYVNEYTYKSTADFSHLFPSLFLFIMKRK